MRLELSEFIISSQMDHSVIAFEIHNLSVFYQSFYALTESQLWQKEGIISKTFVKFLRYELAVTLHLLQGCVRVGILQKILKKIKIKECKKKLHICFYRNDLIGYLKKHSDWLLLFKTIIWVSYSAWGKLHDRIAAILINIGFLARSSSVQLPTHLPAAIQV